MASTRHAAAVLQADIGLRGSVMTARSILIIALCLQLLVPRSGFSGDLSSRQAAWSFEKAKIRVAGVDKRTVLVRHVVIGADSLRFLAPAQVRNLPPMRSARLVPGTLALNEVEEIQLPLGNRARVGALVGACVAGGILAALTLADASSDNVEVEATATGIFFFLLTGAGIGALTGADSERWQPAYVNALAGR